MEKLKQYKLIIGLVLIVLATAFYWQNVNDGYEKKRECADAGSRFNAYYLKQLLDPLMVVSYETGYSRKLNTCLYYGIVFTNNDPKLGYKTLEFINDSLTNQRIDSIYYTSNGGVSAGSYPDFKKKKEELFGN